ncbi:hypothetical protein [uncultured Algibacter sp.]|uniref:hypothetical protein n=1 Tax=uncultured Algibacter sp. TaxID=298659 RepID=UPI002635637B|nr:hypothetical protein [uncultured Algibacter sp.]
METLVATVLIVVVFMVASMILNNLFSNTTKKNTRNINAHLNELEYLFKNDKLTLPYYDGFNTWEVSLKKIKENDQSIVITEAINTITNKIITKETIEE